METLTLLLLALYGVTDHGGHAPRDEPSRLAVIRSAPDFELTDQDGKLWQSSNLKRQVTIVSFIFTTCNGTCPATTHRLSLVHHELKSRGLKSGGQIRFVSISLDPDRDSPAVLRRYMDLYDLDDGVWSFLTGSSSSVNTVLTAWGMWTRPAANGQLDHPSRVFLIDARGRIREIYNLGFLKPAWVADDVALLLSEISDSHGESDDRRRQSAQPE